VSDGIIDSNIVIDLLRQIPSSVSWYANLQRQRIAITPIVWMEVVQGARNKTERRQIVRFLMRFTIEHPTSHDNQWAMSKFARFRVSHGVEYQDLMIASVAVGLAIPLYTRNTKHYHFLPRLKLVRPY
jgi:predicted nucleic acid-binding protein